MGIGKTKQGKVKRFKEKSTKKKDCNSCECESENSKTLCENEKSIKSDETVVTCGGEEIVENLKNINLAQEASELF